MSKRLGRVAVGLSGGAAKGLAHIGALEALVEREIVPDVIAGTSAGAMVGGLYAAGISPDELRDIVRDIDQEAFGKLIDLTWASGSLVAGARVEAFLKSLVGDVKIEDLDIPFVATTVDINSGVGYYLQEGSLVDAIRASISIPGIFEPVIANEGYLVDGGLRRNLPLEVLRRYDPDTMVAVSIRNGSSLDLQWMSAPIERNEEKRPRAKSDIWQRLREYLSSDNSQKRDLPGVAFLASQAFNILAADLARAEIALAKPELVIELDMSGIELWEFWRGVDAADLGYEQSQDAINSFMGEE
jgi:NTE family protein